MNDVVAVYIKKIIGDLTGRNSYAEVYVLLKIITIEKFKRVYCNGINYHLVQGEKVLVDSENDVYVELFRLMDIK